MSTPEAKVKAAIKKWLDERGFWRAGTEHPPERPVGWYYMPQNMGMGVSGIPDFVGSFMGLTEEHDPAFAVVQSYPFAIEAKAPGKRDKTTAQQKDRHAEMRATGWLVLVVDDVSQLAATPLNPYNVRVALP